MSSHHAHDIASMFYSIISIVFTGSASSVLICLIMYQQVISIIRAFVLIADNITTYHLLHHVRCTEAGTLRTITFSGIYSLFWRNTTKTFSRITIKNTFGINNRSLHKNSKRDGP